MSTDARMGDALVSMVRGIDVPHVPLEAIHRRMDRRSATDRRPLPLQRLALLTAAIVAVAFVAFPSSSAALIQSIEARYRAALQALGGSAPPDAPARFAASLSQAGYTIVPPAGLPRDVSSSSIATAPTGVYSAATRSWSVGSPSVTFTYHRTGGRTFMLLADRYDPKAEPVGMYMFEALDPAADGTPRIVRHRRFAWRNGDQITIAIDGTGISSAEIVAIRTAMHGVALPQRDLHVPANGARAKLYVAP